MRTLICAASALVLMSPFVLRLGYISSRSFALDCTLFSVLSWIQFLVVVLKVIALFSHSLKSRFLLRRVHPVLNRWLMTLAVSCYSSVESLTASSCFSIFFSLARTAHLSPFFQTKKKRYLGRPI